MKAMKTAEHSQPLDMLICLPPALVELSCVSTAHGLLQDLKLMCWVGHMGKGRVLAGQLSQVLASTSVDEF